ncbi:hydantoinase [Hypericibacter terrae]|uniref:Hydantoinase n=1 Tax=Hypericibacter terrae TaxID=2602015 RepID=A0A5J6MSJ5_9PROT|nr:hydantoinase/oxoprolinase family protein [Hypericibacter terrae]QEX20067.1 hydantoinase [Hypericibacter terrae]
MIKMAIEVGGTFTDLIWLDEAGEVRTHKLPSTPRDPSVGVIDGLEQALGSKLTGLSQLFHGSTVATNAILERKGCRAAFLTTRGFRDILQLQRQLRPNVYAIACKKPEPLVPLSRSVEVTERLDAAGEVVLPLDEEELLNAVDKLVRVERVEAIAICLLHAYRNPAHEERVRRLIEDRYPDLPVVLSTKVLPTFREYERASTTAMAAYLVPLVGRYLGRLEKHLAQSARDSDLFIMQSSGGVLPSAGSRDRGVDMLNSGPAAGVIGAVRVADVIGDKDVITLDVGGTSADICLIAGGNPGITAETEVDGLPVGLPSIDIANIGAGGGSLGWIDAGGMLQVGPRSAGARPGPACYGYGGTAPTITDALVRLGWIRPHRFLGGRMTLLPERADEVLTSLAKPLGQSADALAQAMVEIGAAHIGQGIRLVSVQRGHDPKHYALYGYGGMGPMIGALAAGELSIRRVVIPPYPGLFSALGLLVADLKRIYRRTNLSPVEDSIGAKAAEIFTQMRKEAEAEFAAFGQAARDLQFEHALEMRFRGQGFELLTPVDTVPLAAEGASYLHRLFRDMHRTRYGASAFGEAIEIVSFRLVAQVPTPRDALDQVTRGAAGAAKPHIEEGHVLFRGKTIPCRFAWRQSLPEGFALSGAAIIEEPTATTLVPPCWTATVARGGSLVLTPEPKEQG